MNAMSFELKQRRLETKIIMTV